MKFRKKPVVIEAEQFFYQDAAILGDRLGVHQSAADGKYYIDTLEGHMEVGDGDWVITGVKGERYACKPDIFEMTYEPVPEDALSKG